MPEDFKDSVSAAVSKIRAAEKEKSDRARQLHDEAAKIAAQIKSVIAETVLPAAQAFKSALVEAGQQCEITETPAAQDQKTIARPVIKQYIVNVSAIVEGKVGSVDFSFEGTKAGIKISPPRLGQAPEVDTRPIGKFDRTVADTALKKMLERISSRP
jgi:hypothetical protein